MSAWAAGTRGGATLVEATTALALAGVLIACLAGVLSVVGRLARAHARVTAQSDTERAVGAILGAELRALTAADATFHADSVRLRAFRGGGAVCSVSGETLSILYQGVRSPEPDKDSVLLVWSAGERAFAIDEATSAADCAAAGEVAPIGIAAAWRTSDSAEVPAFALVFETGAYSLSSSAFRYRRGAAGRQPLSEENLSDAGSGLTRAPRDAQAAVAAITLRPAGSRRSATTAWTLYMPQGSARPSSPP